MKYISCRINILTPIVKSSSKPLKMMIEVKRMEKHFFPLFIPIQSRPEQHFLNAAQSILKFDRTNSFLYEEDFFGATRTKNMHHLRNMPCTCLLSFYFFRLHVSLLLYSFHSTRLCGTADAVVKWITRSRFLLPHGCFGLSAAVCFHKNFLESHQCPC